MSKQCVFELFEHFTNAKEGVEDVPRSGRPSTSITPDNIKRVIQMIVADSPDLAPADLLALKGLRLADVADIKQRVTMVLRAITQEGFPDNIQQHYKLFKKCVVANGDYFEGL
ncbi:hypothetical protein C0J52_28430 [Blattella germanica]|nr:hypothetical protein C0J52_28430 [Blattella germanica]